MGVVVKELTTGYIIPKIPGYTYYKLENYFTAMNHHTKERDPFGIIDSDKYIRIPKIEIEHLSNLLNIDFELVTIAPTPFNKLSKTMVMKNQPKDEIQADVIKNIINAYNEGYNRAVVSLPTGQGKTYVATNIISQVNTPTIIFVKNRNLRDQWLESFHKHSSVRNIALCEGSADLTNVLEAGINYDIIITTHRSAQIFIDQVGMRRFNEMLIKQGIGFKIFDEFDLEADSTFKIETHTNVNKTLYLSATDYKSPNTNKVFQAVYGHLPNYGKNYGIVVPRKAIFLHYNSKPTKSQFGKCHRYTRDGFTFDYQKYHESMVNNKWYEKGLKMMWDKVIKKRFEDTESYLKTVFFIGRKNTAEQFRKDISSIFGISPASISILNSDTPKSQREKATRYKLIISTADSLGRGVDLQGLDTVVDLETRNSLSKSTQVIGRVSRSGMKTVGTYITFVDKAFPTVLRNYSMKMDQGFYETQFTEMINVNLDKDDK